MTTATADAKIIPAGVLRELESLLGLAAEVAAAEDRLERAARAAKWTEGAHALVDAVPIKFSGAARREILDALHDAGGTGKADSCLSALDVCQSIQDAIDVLKFAIERSESS